jgi:hypothetical protein
MEAQIIDGNQRVFNFLANLARSSETNDVDKQIIQQRMKEKT